MTPVSRSTVTMPTRVGGVDEDLALADLGEVLDGRDVDELVAGEHQHGGEHRRRDLREDEGKRRAEHEQPDTVEERRSPGLRTRLDVRATAHDDARHRERSEQTAEHVADALGRELLIETGPRTVVHLVHGRGAEERLRARHEGEGEARRHHGEPEAVEPRHGGEQHRFGQLIRNVDPGDGQAAEHGHDRRDHDRRQGRWHRLEAARTMAFQPIMTARVSTPIMAAWKWTEPSAGKSPL